MAPTPDLGRTFCDIIMKGGITSGVVYPTAIAGLARKYRLRNIGGASAGAIAAGAAAAAEYRRQADPAHPEAGFERLAAMDAELGKPLEGDPSGRTRLFHLFAPTRLSQPLFSVLAGMLNRKAWGGRVGFGLLALFRAFPGGLAVGVVVWALAVAPVVAGFLAAAPTPLGDLRSPLGWAASALAVVSVTGFAAAAVLGVALWESLRHFARVMAAQDFGLCTGMREPGSKEAPALTEWMHQLLQDTSGKPAGAPLTFGDLRRVRFAETPDMDGVVLRVMTTCLTLGRPYTLPIQERLFFDPVELGRFFPPEVVAWMTAHARGSGDLEDADVDAHARLESTSGRARPLLPIPAPDDFPVVVALRMSLSFPILLSAIPLHRYSVRRDGSAWVPTMERLVFTDGGVCSNLPIHLFDSPLPEWPTFALNLKDDLPAGSAEDERVLPPRRGRTYFADRLGIPEKPTLGATGAFLGAIVNTMQNWRDNLQRAAPGARERLFTVRHTRDEGGLNLDMKASAIAVMARSGKLAADAMKAAFQPPSGTPPAEDDWQHHRWVRLRLLLPVLRRFLDALASGTRPAMGRPSIEELLTGSPPPMGRSHELNQASGAAGWELLRELTEASGRAGATHPDFERTAPRPEGTLRVIPDF